MCSSLLEKPSLEARKKAYDKAQEVQDAHVTKEAHRAVFGSPSTVLYMYKEALEKRLFH